MAEITREEFEKIYKTKLVPDLKDLEIERLENKKKENKAFLAGLLFILMGIIIFIAVTFKKFGLYESIICATTKVIFVLFAIAFAGVLSYVSKIHKAHRQKLKKMIVQKILTTYGNLYFSEKKDIISHKEIHNMGLFRQSTSQKIDDVIIGVDRGLNFVIAETKLTHQESREDKSETITDFSGIILKIQMHKNFTGKTIVGIKNNIVKMRGFERVKLESVDFMKDREIYSTDQIEARYILTPTFIERLQNLGMNFVKGYLYACNEAYNGDKAQMDKAIETIESIKNNVPPMLAKFTHELIERNIIGISAAFIDGYVYLFIPTSEDFFEVDYKRDSLLNCQLYYNIYKQIGAILNIIDYLHLDNNTGI